MSKQRSIHLFNCDRTYKLDAVEDWLEATKPKLGCEISVKQHYFHLTKMSEMSNETIPGLQMDVAVFVVHAHESRLSINEENAGIGYAKIYRALLDKTENNVIIVIGGDDNYKDEDEEEREFISRWARRKVSSQFSDEFMDGRKSFIISWDKKHRKIHEKALLHFFDRSKKGEKFVPQPPEPKAPTKSVTQPPPRRVPEPSRKKPEETKPREKQDTGDPLQCDSVFEAKRGKGACASPSHGPQAKGNLPSHPGKAVPSGQATASRQEPKFSSTGRNKQRDMSVLGWNAKPESLSAVTQLIERRRDILNLAEAPEVYNVTVCEMISYLEKNPLKYGVLVVDAEKVKVASDLEQSGDYLRLLKTAERNVEVKIIIVVCIPPAMSKEDETVVIQTIANAFSDNRKVFVAWFINGKLEPPEDDLIMFLTSTNVDTTLHPRYKDVASQSPEVPGFGASQRGAQKKYEGSSSQKFQKHASSAPTSPYVHQPREITENQQFHSAAVSFPFQIYLPPAKTALILTHLRKGRISNRPEDVEYWKPGFVVPGYMESELYSKYWNKPDEELVILLNEKDEPVYMLDKRKEKGWQKFIILELDETVKLETRIKNGEISFNPKDVFVSWQNWRVPQRVVESLKIKYRSRRNAELFVISNSKGDLRCVVRDGTYRDYCVFDRKTFE